ncbi:hypothetical protein WA026_005116 [Henosepilachna vigintioctopunctata]|uniref:Reverse transcriptase domain-containing protein n=1 Tax=Henosepilachna vigintioctopunctata TaxID=420089 RepID=A0AAW1UW32_9CUCU
MEQNEIGKATIVNYADDTNITVRASPQMQAENQARFLSIAQEWFRTNNLLINAEKNKCNDVENTA